MMTRRAVLRGRIAAVTALALAAAVCATGSASAWGKEWIVDVGNPAAADTNAGTAESPLKTISKGVAMAEPGDTVTVKGGTYRETVMMAKSGTADARIVLRAAPGERAIVSGADVVKGWRRCTKEEGRGNPNWEKLWVAEVGRGPSALYQDGAWLSTSRWPADGRYTAQGGSEKSVIDAEHLDQPAGFWEGGTLQVRVEKVRSSRRGTIVGYDPDKHELVTEKGRDEPIVGGTDSYWVENLVSIIDAPGEWALDGRGKSPKVYLWPLEDRDPNEVSIEGSQRGPLLVGWDKGVGYLTISGLEAAYGWESAFGSSAEGAHDIVVENCVAHHNLRAGFDMRNQEAATIRHCVSTQNQFGILFAGAKRCTVEENYLLTNMEDGLVVSWKSEDVRVVRNCIRDHWRRNHPDGFQIYRGVKNLTVESNLIFDGGQGFMSEQGDGGKWTNNMIVCCHHTGLSLGHRSVDNYEMTNNTIAFTGFRAMTFSGKNTKMRNNLLVTGGDGLLVLGQGTPADVDWNFYWKSEGARTQMPEGQDAHSKAGDPKFRSAPPLVGQACYIIAQWTPGKAEKCTPGKFYLTATPVSKYFAVGDYVEVNFDGVVRRVTEATDEYVAFEPALPRLSEYRWEVLVNWKDRQDFTWDLRLADDSPARGAGEGGVDAGSSIDTQAYLRGDFNGDGRRDVPALPPEAKLPRP